jgi:glutamate synthase domain-containing protein 3
LTLIQNHAHYTGSAFARRILEDWNDMYHLFVKVFPMDYRKALDRIKKEEFKETETVAMTEEVFK